MTGTADSVRRMANNIARNFVAIGHDEAVAATADHIASFWNPRMKRIAFALIEEEDSGFSDIARAALRLLAEAGAPEPQTPATESAKTGETGHSDAG